MARIAILGAGGYAFPLRMVVDLLSFPELQASEIVLMDIVASRVNRTGRLARDLVKTKKLPARIVTTTSLEEALEGTAYVIVTWQVGGLEAYEPDVEIPRRYGIDQCVGDTHGPGGVFRFLRTWPAYMKVAEAMKRLCPDALMINYANPMAMNCWGVNETGVKVVGLCHSVQGTSRMLAEMAGLDYDRCSFKCYGINHQAWFTEFRCGGRDVYDRVRKAMFAKFPSPVASGCGGKVAVAPGASKLAVDHGDHYHQETVRTEIMRTFGYFHTESSHHGSEYVAWFRKNPRLIKAYIRKRWDYLQLCRTIYTPEKERARVTELLKSPLEASEEYGARIVHAMETDAKAVIYGNVPNYGPPGSVRQAPAAHLIGNLPQDCCVEVACLVDRNGIQPTSPGPLPSQCAAMNLQHVAVQRLAVEAAQTGDPMKVLQAVTMDPLTGALLTLPQIRDMVRDLFAAHRKRLPQFKNVKL
ncbi:MAG: alpha-galactosidase [Planctomycetes bacterium]|nr:alpha-galactosidase [Planctomycetota bacterium]